MDFSIFIFRRDLRVKDNCALDLLSKTHTKVIPIFIFDPHQIAKTRKNAHYRSDTAISFMMESLDDLNVQLSKFGSKLFLFRGNPAKIISKLISRLNVKVVAFNADFTPYAKFRDKKIKEECERKNVECMISFNDNLLNAYEENLNGENRAYVVFSAFHKRMLSAPKLPILNKSPNFIEKNKRIRGENRKSLVKISNKLIIGGRNNAKKILKNIHKYKEYSKNRDKLMYSTTHLSAYIKFGCVSIRECYYAIRKKLNKKHPLLTQLYWNCFYTILANFRESYTSFIDPRFLRVPFKANYRLWTKMWTGNTGFLAVDAGVRQLLSTGWCHNRARLLIGNFATKVLLLPPFAGKYASQAIFSKLLIDGMFSNNMGNWSWVCGDKVDPSGARFGKGGISGRFFDPRAFRKWDPSAEYVLSGFEPNSYTCNGYIFFITKFRNYKN